MFLLKAAVVGLRNIGKLHCRYYQEIPNVRLVAVCDLDEKLAEAASLQFGVKSYTDLKALLENEEVDVVSIATGGIENGSHHREWISPLCASHASNENGKRCISGEAVIQSTIRSTRNDRICKRAR